jgi:hypothetical protein
MKKCIFFILLLISIVQTAKTQAQGTWNVSSGCNGTSPTVEQVVIDACGTEGYTEFFLFSTGSASFNPSTITSSSSSGAIGTPFTAANYSGTNATAAGIVTMLNSWVGACATTVFIAAPNPIPPNSKVIAFNSPSKSCFLLWTDGICFSR